MKKTEGVPGLNESWENFPWHQYPGGVQVSFALVMDKTLHLLRPSRWSFVFPQYELRREQTLADALLGFHQQLEQFGATVLCGGAEPEACACTVDRGVYHAMIIVPCNFIGPADLFEKVSNAILLSGYQGDHPLSSELAHKLNWQDASRHLPRRQSAHAA